MYQRQLAPKQAEKKRIAPRRAATGPQAVADLEGSPQPGLPSLGQLLLSLQGRYGNRHVQQVVNAVRQDSPALPIQAKLLLGSDQDEYEREADRLAEQAVNGTSQPVAASQVGAEAREQTVLRKTLPARGHALADRQVDPETEDAIRQARGSGSPLPESFRMKMERSMGADFSGVRLHTGTPADQLNRLLRARAFTTGEDIFVRRSDYAPGSQNGQLLLAHELAHVVQQGLMEVPIIRRKIVAAGVRGALAASIEAYNSALERGDATIDELLSLLARVKHEHMNDPAADIDVGQAIRREEADLSRRQESEGKGSQLKVGLKKVPAEALETKLPGSGDSTEQSAIVAAKKRLTPLPVGPKPAGGPSEIALAEQSYRDAKAQFRQTFDILVTKQSRDENCGLATAINIMKLMGRWNGQQIADLYFKRFIGEITPSREIFPYPIATRAANLQNLVDRAGRHLARTWSNCSEVAAYLKALGLDGATYRQLNNQDLFNVLKLASHAKPIAVLEQGHWVVCSKATARVVAGYSEFYDLEIIDPWPARSDVQTGTMGHDPHAAVGSQYRILTWGQPAKRDLTGWVVEVP